MASMIASKNKPQLKSVRRPPKNRKTKTNLVFNEQDRRDFLKGFKKRKDERRIKAKEEMEKKLKEEKKRIKEEHREYMKKLIENQRTVPEVEHLLNRTTYDLPGHSVTIASADNADLAGSTGLMLGVNQGSDSESEKDPEASQDKESAANKPKVLHRGIQNVRQILRKDSTKQMKKSKAVAMKNKLKQKKDRQKSRHQRFLNRKNKPKRKNQLKQAGKSQ